MQGARQLSLLKRDADSVYALREGVEVTTEVFRRHVAVLQAGLPEASWYCNLCADPYWFAATFIAVAARGGVNLLPPNRNAATLAALLDNYSETCVVSDGVLPVAASFINVQAIACGDIEASLPDAFGADLHVARVFTSGSTGPSSALDKTWGELFAGAGRNNALLQSFVADNDTIVATVPPGHMYGLEWCIVSPLQRTSVLYTGQTFFPEEICAALESVSGPRRLLTTPLHLSALLRSGRKLPHVDLIMSATSPLGAELALAATRELGGRLLEIYGCSEAGSLAWREPASDERWRFMSDFNVSVAGDEVRVTSSDLPAEIQLADTLEFESDGRFRIAGRKGDLVKVGGKRESLQRLNQLLNSIESVKDGVFFLRPADDTGLPERLAAAVVTSESAESLRSRLAEMIDPVFMPRPILKVEALPREPTGKLPYSSLVALLQQHSVVVDE